MFGSDVVQSFLRKHDMDLVVRAHQVVGIVSKLWGPVGMMSKFNCPSVGRPVDFYPASRLGGHVHDDSAI